MKKEAILIGLVVFMALVNAAILMYFLSGPHTPEPLPLDRQVVATLQLDEVQQRAFQKLKATHHQQMVTLDEQFKTLLEAYFQSVQQPTVDKDSLEARLSALEKRRLQLTYTHLRAIRDLCTAPQRRQFEQLLPAMIHAMAGPPKKK